LLLKKREELSATHTRANENATVEADLEAWLARVSLLKERLRQMPEKNIPEMRFLNSGDWLSVTLNNTLQTEAKVRLALKELRLKAKLKLEIGPNLQNALRAYSKAHGDRTATDWADLRPYLQPSLGDDILQRYEFLPAAVSAADESVTNKDDRNALQEKAAVDEDYDSLFNFSSRGFGYQYASKFGDQVNQASRAFIKANNGEFPVRFEQLLPYFSTAADETRLKEFWEAGRP
jgi:hypothetical protein